VNPLDRDAVIRALEANLATLEALVAALPDEGATGRADGGWTPRDIVEHLVAVEGSVHRVIRKALTLPPSERRTRERDAMIAGLATLPRKVQAPEIVAPSGRFASAAEAMVALREARAHTIHLARTVPAPWDAQHLPHPFFGELDIGQWLLMAATHGDRHARQISAS
jgi:hypothetical protein